MRKFKFRIWDNENNCFYISENPYLEDGTKEEERFITTEFTGLKDKSRRDIYEGDIIGINREQTSLRLPVKFGRYSFDKLIGECGEISDSTELYGFYVENEYLYIQMLNGNVEVLGNTFQNKKASD
ncbi:YopX family protein [Clostridium sp. JNZ X4-2]